MNGPELRAIAARVRLSASSSPFQMESNSSLSSRYTSLSTSCHPGLVALAAARRSLPKEVRKQRRTLGVSPGSGQKRIEDVADLAARTGEAASDVLTEGVFGQSAEPHRAEIDRVEKGLVRSPNKRRIMPGCEPAKM